MTQNYDELLKRLDNDSRYSQGNCLKCAKGFENHEYHCWGQETEGCMASQKELQITVLQWKKERKQASTAIRTLQAERDAAYNQAIADWEVLQTARIATLEAALREAREALEFSIRACETSASVIRDPNRTKAIGRVRTMVNRIANQFDRLATRSTAAITKIYEVLK